jgi:hypothetical protein
MLDQNILPMALGSKKKISKEELTLFSVLEINLKNNQMILRMNPRKKKIMRLLTKL